MKRLVDISRVADGGDAPHQRRQADQRAEQGGQRPGAGGAGADTRHAPAEVTLARARSAEVSLPGPRDLRSIRAPHPRPAAPPPVSRGRGPRPAEVAVRGPQQEQRPPAPPGGQPQVRHGRGLARAAAQTSADPQPRGRRGLRHGE